MDLDGSCKMVKAAFDLGINWIDTSPFYGLTKAETMLGNVLSELRKPRCFFCFHNGVFSLSKYGYENSIMFPVNRFVFLVLYRDEFYLMTKVGRYGPDEFDFSPERVVRSVNESLSRIGVDYFDLVFCHDIEFTSLDKLIRETFPALRKLKESGKIRHIGISGYPLSVFKYILENTRDAPSVEAVLSYCHYCLQNTSLQDFIPLFRQFQVGIINASPLSMGLLTRKGPPKWHPASVQMKDLCQAAARRCEQFDEPIEKLANQFAFSNVDIDSTLTGSGSELEIRQNIQWLQETLESISRKGSGYNEELFIEVKEILQPVLNQEWTSGLPENLRKGSS